MVNLAKIKIGSVRYNSPIVQVCLLGFVVFCTVGMFSAIGGLGAGGTQDIVLSNITNAVLYATFAIGGLFAGGVTNMLGPRLTLFVGSLGYALYVGGLWCHQVNGNRWFLILSGAILGLCASLLWSAQGCLMMALPEEHQKGRAFSIFWTIFSMGSLVGGLIVLGLTINQGKVASLGTGIYIAFIIIMFIGSASTVTILPPHKVIRNDGTIVEVHKQPTAKEEMMGMWTVIKDKRIIMLLPMFFASNYFYAYQGSLVAYSFNGRTRALSSVLTGLGAIVGAIVVGIVLDSIPFKTRKMRGYFGISFVFVVLFVTWGCALAFQLTFKRESVGLNLDWSDDEAKKPLVLLLFLYFGDAGFQGLAYWIMGTLSNDPKTLARYAGIYKAVQSAGSAGSFGMDATLTPYLNEVLVSALLAICSLPLAAYVVSQTADHTSDIEGEVMIEDVILDQDMAMPSGHHAAMVDDKLEREKSHA